MNAISPFGSHYPSLPEYDEYLRWRSQNIRFLLERSNAFMAFVCAVHRSTPRYTGSARSKAKAKGLHVDVHRVEKTDQNGWLPALASPSTHYYADHYTRLLDNGKQEYCLYRTDQRRRVSDWVHDDARREWYWRDRYERKVFVYDERRRTKDERIDGWRRNIQQEEREEWRVVDEQRLERDLPAAERWDGYDLLLAPDGRRDGADHRQPTPHHQRKIVYERSLDRMNGRRKGEQDGPHNYRTYSPALVKKRYPRVTESNRPYSRAISPHPLDTPPAPRMRSVELPDVHEPSPAGPSNWTQSAAGRSHWIRERSEVVWPDYRPAGVYRANYREIEARTRNYHHAGSQTYAYGRPEASRSGYDRERACQADGGRYECRQDPPIPALPKLASPMVARLSEQADARGCTILSGPLVASPESINAAPLARQPKKRKYTEVEDDAGGIQKVAESRRKLTGHKYLLRSKTRRQTTSRRSF
ncbi:hypothetical protein OE88DRAFT_1810632 [Heliocybe sulcata]|uniref:Uncharacterized protein n=1 Tax=Heliocybe sulcata TaxID=5364 RepID=A0A5C3MRF7_9AGAM|nr:hypothetical protein OE88DRAFT_1810632 [Heliocybe sulcata]